MRNVKVVKIINGNQTVEFQVDDSITLEQLQSIAGIFGVTLPQVEIDSKTNQLDVETRFNLSQLANKTPQEIYTAIQGAMDGWETLADARADLREWLPLMAAIIAWKVQ